MTSTAPVRGAPLRRGGARGAEACAGTQFDPEIVAAFARRVAAIVQIAAAA